MNQAKHPLINTPCQVCGAVPDEIIDAPATYGEWVLGPWMYLCAEHYAQYGVRGEGILYLNRRLP